MAKKKMGFVIHVERCIGCSACEVACKSFYQLEPEMSRRTITQLPETATGEPTRSYFSSGCNHCDEPACLKACPVEAYTKREDGIVVHDPEYCIGCKQCATACPFSAPVYNPETKKMDKCSLCYDRLDAGEEPICVKTCPLGAIEVVDLNADDRHLESQVPNYPDTTITGANIRFILPTAGKQIRRDV